MKDTKEKKHLWKFYVVINTPLPRPEKQQKTPRRPEIRFIEEEQIEGLGVQRRAGLVGSLGGWGRASIPCSGGGRGGCQGPQAAGFCCNRHPRVDGAGCLGTGWGSGAQSMGVVARGAQQGQAKGRHSGWPGLPSQDEHLL